MSFWVAKIVRIKWFDLLRASGDFEGHFDDGKKKSIFLNPWDLFQPPSDGAVGRSGPSFRVLQLLLIFVILVHKNRNFVRIDLKPSQISWKLLDFSRLTKNSDPTQKLRFLGL